MTALLVRSVSGVRGVVGDSLTARVMAAHAWAFATLTQAKRVVVGRDARPSGPEMLQAALAGLEAAGAVAVDLGLAATPAVQVAVEESGADGGLVITASHNPRPWNGLKCIGRDGTFLGPDAVTALFERADTQAPSSFTGAGTAETETRAVEWHVERNLAVPEVRDVRREHPVAVVVDGCRSVGGPSTVAALERLGVRVVPLDCEPDGDFQRGLEPVPAHLGELGRVVRESAADFGVAHDPDGDRAALVDATGEPVGEELTLAIAVERVLSRRPGPVVVNLSTSRMSEDLARQHGVPFSRSRVGEIHVVEAMREARAAVGGEGNGGVIVPASHYGRDGTLAALLVACHLLETGEALAEVRRRLDRYTMMKAKFEGVSWEVREGDLRAEFPDAELDERDGLRFTWKDAWLHARPSQTEPLVRVLVEADDAERARTLLLRAEESLAATPPAGH